MQRNVDRVEHGSEGELPPPPPPEVEVVNRMPANIDTMGRKMGDQLKKLKDGTVH